MTNRAGLAIAAVVLAASCAPVTQTSKLTVAPTEALRCAADQMALFGYRISDVRESDGFVQGERSKHVSNPFSGSETFDRMSVVVSSAKLRVVGECMTTAPARPPMGFGGGGRVGPAGDAPRWLFPSAALRDETKRIATSCAGVPPSEQASDSGS